MGITEKDRQTSALQRIDIPPEVEGASSPDTAVTIISSKAVQEAMVRKTERIQRTYDSDLILLVSIEKGGHRVSEDIANGLNLDDDQLNPIRISYYDENNQRLPNPVVKQSLDQERLERFIHSLPPGSSPIIIIGEAVVETGNTLKTATAHLEEKFRQTKEILNRPDLSSPTIITEALVQKTAAADPINNVNAEFYVSPDYWIQGYGCDDEMIGRERDDIAARPSPFRE